jgi:hypothetical protein
MICVPHPSTIKTCVSMTISQNKKNATKYSHLVFSFVSMMQKISTKENIHCNDA